MLGQHISHSSSLTEYMTPNNLREAPQSSPNLLNQLRPHTDGNRHTPDWLIECYLQNRTQSQPYGILSRPTNALHTDYPKALHEVLNTNQTSSHTPQQKRQNGLAQSFHKQPHLKQKKQPHRSLTWPILPWRKPANRRSILGWINNPRHLGHPQSLSITLKPGIDLAATGVHSRHHIIEKFTIPSIPNRIQHQP